MCARKTSCSSPSRCRSFQASGVEGDDSPPRCPRIPGLTLRLHSQGIFTLSHLRRLGVTCRSAGTLPPRRRLVP